jgi:predicted metalloprotease with PDZ domain
VLFDSPFLLGELEALPPFYVRGKPHYFIGYQLGAFDRKQFMADLKKIVESSIAIIGDVPYNHYTFLAIGPGMGGIEHLNSTSLSFSNGEGFDSPEGRKRLYSFIAHEYFHHYNVKRIRPIELGPFDYAKENKTNMLWVSEGFTVYYEYLILKRAGLTNNDDVLKALQSNIIAYENKPGRLFQSATQASYDTWSDGPFGRTGDEVNKTISYYDKGPVLGMMLDLNIRQETNNKQSLDNVMRLLYKKYYQTKKRGFTEAAFQMECEKMAGTSLAEVFSYAATVTSINYPKYFAYAGLAIDTLAKELPGIYFGATTKYKDSLLTIAGVEWNSPAWNAGLREKDIIVETDGAKAGADNLRHLLTTKNPGDTLKLLIIKNNNRQQITVALAKKSQKPFTISFLPNQSALQKEIYQGWLNK